MSDLTALQSFWILAVNTLLHELGLPLPVMPTAFVMGARGVHGAGDLLLLIAAVAAGMLIGNSVWFAAGRHYGAGVLKFLCRFSLTADTCVSRTEQVFGRWGWSSLVVGRFVPGVSLVAPPLAGALGMSWGKFLALTTAGAASLARPRCNAALTPAHLRGDRTFLMDRTQLEKYWASIGPTLEGQPIKVLAGYTPFEVLEGENVLGAFVGEWPSMEAAKAWYDGPGYKAIRHLRMDNARYTGLLLEAGFAPEQERLRNRIR
jgi:uncharacterized protein (DUF1330 family)